MTTGLTIRRAEAADTEAVCELITAFAAYVEMSPPDEAARERVAMHAFGERPLCDVLLAELPEASGPVGYALFFFTYSSFTARPTLYLEDLFVQAEHRRKGIGRALLCRCFRVARERQCGRMEWSCLHRDARAQAVYDGLGAHRKDESFTYRLESEDLERLDGDG